MLAWGSAMALVMLGYALVWAPLVDARNAWRERAVAADASLRWMQTAAQGLQGKVRVAPTADGRSLLARIDATARSSGLAGALLRVEPVTPQQVRAQFQSASFDALGDWLDALKRDQGVRLDDFSIRRAAGSGLVDARVTLSESASK
jgi:general secretion pathway protein M